MKIKHHSHLIIKLKPKDVKVFKSIFKTAAENSKTIGFNKLTFDSDQNDFIVKMNDKLN